VRAWARVGAINTFDRNDRWGAHNATGWNRWVKRAEAKALQAARLKHRPPSNTRVRVIIFLMLAADAVLLWHFTWCALSGAPSTVSTMKLVAVLRVHTSLSAFHDRLAALVDSQDASRLGNRSGPLRSAVLEDTVAP